MPTSTGCSDGQLGPEYIARSSRRSGLRRLACTLAVPSVAGMELSLESVVSFHSVSKLYGQGAGEVRALDDVTVVVPRGGFTAVMGPSGSGKSTFMNLAAGLDDVSAGE